eukprot:7188833-Pyramimonas_sp.AAC.1
MSGNILAWSQAAHHDLYFPVERCASTCKLVCRLSVITCAIRCRYNISSSERERRGGASKLHRQGIVKTRSSP